MRDNTNGVTEADIERLSLIRYQLIEVGETVTAPPPLNTIAINRMQDVVESTLAAVGDHVRASVPARADFDKLFDAVAMALGSPEGIVGQRAQAIALNNARVGFKHHGNQVPDGTLRRHHKVTTTLVTELVSLGFGVKLEEVSLLLFVPHQKVREFIQTAEDARRINDLEKALTYLRVAFDLTIDDYCDRKSVDGRRSIFDAEPIGTSRVSGDSFGVGQITKGLKEWVSALDTRSRLAAIGVDLNRYAYFDAVAPTATPMHHAGRGPIVHVRFKELTDDHYRSSYAFVVDTAIRLSASDYDLRQVRPNNRTPESYDPTYRSERFLESQRRNDDLRAMQIQRDATRANNPGASS